MSDNICDFQFKRIENHNFTNNQYEPACAILSLLDIVRKLCIFQILRVFFELYKVGIFVLLKFENELEIM